MKRREFIALVGGAATWPLAARAQQATPVIGFLSGGAADYTRKEFLPEFRRGLGEAGFSEGRNVVIEYRWAEGHNERLPALAAELVRRPVDAIVTSGGDASAHAAKAATETIPIVFVMANDPVTSGLVASLNRPGRNITGISRLGSELLAKRLELLREVVPNAAEIAFLVNPANPATKAYMVEVEAAGRSLDQTIAILTAATTAEIEAAFLAIVRRRIRALLISNDPFFSSNTQRLANLTVQHAVPAGYVDRGFVAAGGLMSYGGSLADAYYMLGGYTGRILRGEKPAQLPVQQQTRFTFVINLKTAKALGITVPLPLVGRADEVIE